MFRRAHLAIVGLVVLCLTGGVRQGSPPAPAIEVAAAHPHPAAARSVRASKLPLRFEANAGQWDPRVRFVAHDHGATLSLTDDGMTIALRDAKTSKAAAVTMKLVGVRPSAPRGEKELVTKSNFFLGNDPAKWRTNVPNFAEVRAKRWLPGVDVVWHRGPGGLEYDLDVAPEVDASVIAIDVDGASALAVARDGSLEMTTTAGTLVQKAPRVVQDGRELGARYRIAGGRRVRFDLDGYERGRPVLIDPVVYSTYLGGSALDIEYKHNQIAVDSSGGVYVVADTTSTDYPTVNAVQTSNAGSNDVVVSKLASDGQSLAYSTYLGGQYDEEGYGIAVDSNGGAYVSGYTQSSNFPTTTSAFQTTFGGGGTDGFVTALDAAGALHYSTFLGGKSGDTADAVAVDSSGHAYVTGGTSSSDFPTTSGAYQTTYQCCGPYVTKLSSDGATLVYSTYVGNSAAAYGIALDSSGAAYITGFTTSGGFPTVNAFQGSLQGSQDAFVSKLNSSGSALSYSTYLGGTSTDTGYGIAVDSSGSAYVTGVALSANFPTTSGSYETSVNYITDHAFVTKFTSSGSSLSYSTYLDSPQYPYGSDAYGIAVDASGSAWVSGATALTTFPVVNPVQGTNGGNEDAFVTQFTPDGSALDFSTYLGGSANDYGYGVALDTGGSVYVTGVTGSTNFPTASPYQSSNAGNSDLFIAKLTNGPVPLGLSPSSATVPPKGAKTFTAYGGSGSGYTYSLSTNASGASINSSTGVYTAGSTPNVTDVVEVTDSANSTATANVTVGAGVSISPPSPAPPPKGTINFSAAGGSGTGFTWSLTTNNSGASINSSTGAYTAGATASVTDTVEATDSLGNVGTANVTVGPGISVSPATPTSPPKGALTFSASGGSGTGYAFALTTNASGGSINSSTGDYTAGATGNVNDTVTVTDSLGNIGNATVSVGPGVSISPSAPAAPPNGPIAFSASGGSDAGFAWSLSSNQSGGSIDGSSGAYKAGSTGSSVDTVAVADSLGNTASVNVSVGGGLAINPATPSAPPKGSIAFSVTGGSGSGFAWSLKTNNSGGSIDSSTGAYTAGSTPNVTDSVSATDSLSNTASVNVSVTAGVSITPNALTLAPGATTTFSAAGGSGKGYVWSVATNNSGGNISSAGLYTAGATGGVTDTVQLVDSLGNSATASVTVVSNPIVDAGTDAGPPAPSSGGCGCRAAGSSSSPTSLGALSLLAAVAFVRRRQRRDRRMTDRLR